MMSLLLTLIRSNVTAVGLGALFLLSSGYGYWQKAEVARLHVQLDETRAKALSFERSNLSLVAALKQQNVAVAELARRSEEKRLQAVARHALAKQNTLGLRRSARNIMEFKPEGSTECERIQAVMHRFRQELHDGDR